MESGYYVCCKVGYRVHGRVIMIPVDILNDFTPGSTCAENKS